MTMHPDDDQGGQPAADEPQEETTGAGDEGQDDEPAWPDVPLTPAVTRIPPPRRYR